MGVNGFKCLETCTAKSNSSSELTMAGVKVQFVLLLFYNLASAQDCVIDNRGTHVLHEIRLMRDIECANNVKYPPNSNGTYVQVDAKFILKNFNFDSTEELFSIYTWLIVSWEDDRLKWKPEDYGDIKEVIIYNHNIWYPAVRVMNGDVEQDYKDVYMIPCEVNYTGEVTCIQKVFDRTVCNTKLWDWPYDKQKCKIEVGVWKYPIKKVDLVFKGKAMNTMLAGYGAEWDITDYEQEEDQEFDLQLRMYFTLERHGESLAAIIIYPGIIFAILTITSLFLDIREHLRLMFACYSLANQLLHITILEVMIPKHSVEHPSLILYYRGSIILTILALIMTVILKALSEKETAPPALIEHISDYVTNSRLKFLIWKLEYQKEQCKIWIDCASIINSIMLYAFVIAYVCMYALYVPQPIPFN